ncbi:hypothetical protein SAMN04487946_1249 [Halobellus clavatus]|uniref:site-specific DNA-methyltransferase (adenine-specific) n=2 Tax=Halobellus clavatus TaxID=660517 RepID=A0A1H3KYL3_9EURY|nr:hypothetical protein SAMN04487946_1249 [Halobellus clavatus]
MGIRRKPPTVATPQTEPMTDRRSETDSADEWVELVDGTHLDQYRYVLAESLAAEAVAPTYDAWRQYVRDHHGDVFAAVAADSTHIDGTDAEADASSRAAARELFVETLAFDYLLVRLLESLESQYECELTRPLAADAAIEFDPEFETVHQFVRSRLDADQSFEDALARFASVADSGAVAKLHSACVSPRARRAFGRYDTPPGLAMLALESGEQIERDALETGRKTDRETLEAGRKTDRETLEAGGQTDRDPKGIAVDDENESTGLDFDTESVPLVLDPGCGAGAFVAAAASRLLDEGLPEAASATDGPPDAVACSRLADIVAAVRGFDVSPTAVRASRLAVALAIRPLLEVIDERVRACPRIVLGDVVETTVDDAPLSGQRADVILANPPWLTWDALPERVKSRWRNGPIADPALDLFGREGAEARLGYANDDLSVPYAWTCLDRYLVDGGRAAFVLKRDLLTGPAGERIRRETLGARSITHDHVHDFGSLSPFSGVDAGAVLFTLRIGTGPETTPAADGIPATWWSAADDSAHSRTANEAAEGAGLFESPETMRRSFDRSPGRLVPADPTDPSSAWIREDAERRAIGESGYRIRHGVKDDAKAVYALDRATIERHGIEKTHVYPYLKSKHIVKYGLFGYDHHLVPQRQAGEENEAKLRDETPATYEYLHSHRQRLLERSSSWFEGGPFYSLFGLGQYTWADYKVVWCRLGFKPHFAVVSTVTDPLLGEQPVVPGDHCMFIGTDDEREAHYLCGLLNSAPYQRCLRDISSGGKSSLSKSTVARLLLPEWAATPQQCRLAELSQLAHEIVPDHVDCSKRAYNQKTIPELESVQAEIDRTVEEFLAAHTGRDPRETE